MNRAALVLAVSTGLVLAGCAVPVAGTPQAEAPRTIDGARLEQDVRDYLAATPATAALALADVQCPPAAVPDTRTVLFCQIVGAGRVQSVPITVLDADGDYRIGAPF